jgi:hypothetical protein
LSGSDELYLSLPIEEGKWFAGKGYAALQKFATPGDLIKFWD